MVQEVLIGLSLVIAVSAVVTILARIIRQPPIIAFLFAGIIVGPLCLGLLSPVSSEMIRLFARIGIAFLLFIVGLSLDFRLLREIGKVSILAGLVEVILVSAAGFGIAFYLGFSTTAAIYIGAALAFSSTVVAVKMLSDKREIDTLHGKIAIGILIIQDIIASLFLMAIPLFGSAGNYMFLLREIGLAFVLIAFIFLLSYFFFGKLLSYLAKSSEAMFLFGIAWALIIATLFDLLGFSIEIGALLAGMSLASSKYALDLGGKIKPLRDFFVVLFFVFFGSQLNAINMTLIVQAIILSLFVLILKPLIVMFILKVFGYTKKTNFLASITLAQVSEFSLILIMLGFTLGHVSQEVMNLSILVALITIAISTYAFHYSNFLCSKCLRFLGIFDGKINSTQFKKLEHPEIVLFGYHRIGYKIIDSLKKMNSNFLVVDYNPKVALSLSKQKINCIYGDAGNKNFLSDIGLEKTKLIISTIPSEEVNLEIREFLNEINSSAVFIATAEQPRQALELYNAGIDYVLIPHHLGGDFAAYLIKNLGTKKSAYDKVGAEHKKHLEKSKNNSGFDD